MPIMRPDWSIRRSFIVVTSGEISGWNELSEASIHRTIFPIAEDHLTVKTPFINKRPDETKRKRQQVQSENQRRE
jgi:hypothetical protein